MREIHQFAKEINFSEYVDLDCDKKIQSLCLKTYHNHPHGCPNWGIKKGCPPKAKFFPEAFGSKARIISIKFPFGEYIGEKRIAHPDWTDRALANPRHWQNHLRSIFKEFYTNKLNPNDKIFTSPEGMGVNITSTCSKIGINLEWPPKKFVYQIVLSIDKNDLPK